MELRWELKVKVKLPEDETRQLFIMTLLFWFKLSYNVALGRRQTSIAATLCFTLQTQVKQTLGKPRLACSSTVHCISLFNHFIRGPKLGSYSFIAAKDNDQTKSERHCHPLFILFSPKTDVEYKSTTFIKRNIDDTKRSGLLPHTQSVNSVEGRHSVVIKILFL